MAFLGVIPWALWAARHGEWGWGREERRRITTDFHL